MTGLDWLLIWPEDETECLQLIQVIFENHIPPHSKHTACKIQVQRVLFGRRVAELPEEHSDINTGAWPGRGEWTSRPRAAKSWGNKTNIVKGEGGEFDFPGSKYFKILRKIKRISINNFEFSFLKKSQLLSRGGHYYTGAAITVQGRPLLFLASQRL